MPLSTFQKGSSMPKNGIYYFSAPWCVPCRAIKPILERVQATIIEIDVDEFPAVATYFNISGIPAILQLKDGKQVRRIQGSKSQQDIQEFLRGR